MVTFMDLMHGRKPVQPRTIFYQRLLPLGKPARVKAPSLSLLFYGLVPYEWSMRVTAYIIARHSPLRFFL